MNELIYILRVILKRLPYENFLTGDKEAINLNRDLLSKEVHKYMSFHSDTETRNILESMEDFFRKYGEFFSDKKGIKGISVFDAIFLFSDKMLVIKNNEILVHYENILRWRMLVQDLGEEIFVTAFRAEQDLARGQECKNFDWPVVIGHNNTQLRNLTRRGMAENHFHLWGSAPYFYITWIWMMNHVDVIEKSNDFHRLDNDARTMYMVGGEEKYENSFKKNCIQAALIRVYLCSVLTKQEINIGKYYVDKKLLFPWIHELGETARKILDDKKIFSNIEEIFDFVEQSNLLKKYSFILHDIYTKNIEFPQTMRGDSLDKLLKYALEQEDNIELSKCREVFSKEMYRKLWNDSVQQKILFYLDNYEIMLAHLDQIQRAIDEMSYGKKNSHNVDYMLNYVPVDNLSLREHRHNHILAGERKFLYEMFRYVRENKLKFKPRLYNWFYVYLRMKEKIRGEMVQSNEWVGFENFSIYQNRSGYFLRDAFLERTKAHMAVASCFEQNVIKLEVRFSPYDTAERLCREIRFLDESIDPDKKFRNNYYYVLHFIKKQDNDRKIQSNIYCNYRHSKLREEVRRKTLAILKLREKYADIAQRVCNVIKLRKTEIKDKF